MPTQVGTDVGFGATLVPGYIVLTYTDGDIEFNVQDIRDETGQLKTRIVFQRMEKVTLTMIPLQATNPKAHFPKGQAATHGDFSGENNRWFVDDMQLVETAEADQVTVSLTKYGIPVP